MDAFEKEVWSNRISMIQFGKKRWGNVLSTEDAEELAQDTILAAFKSRSSFRGECALRTWLLSIYRFKALTRLRKAKRTQSIDEIHEGSNEVSDFLIYQPTQEVGLVQSSVADFVRTKVALLSPKHREIVNLVYFQGLEIEEAAERIGIPAATVKTRMFYARQMLREELQLIA